MMRAQGRSLKSGLLYAVSGILLAAGTPAMAAETLSIQGDKDCFGLGGSCSDGSLFRDELGGSFFTDYSTASDPLYTDDWDSFGSVSFDLSYSGGTGTFVEFFIAGIADIGSAYSVFLNGSSIGTIPTNSGVNAFQEARTYSFAVDSSTLLASNTVSFGGTGGDGYIIDYVALMGERSAVPEPATWAMMLIGFFGIGGMVRSNRRKPKVAASYA